MTPINRVGVMMTPPSMLPHSRRHRLWRLREWLRGGIRGVLWLQVRTIDGGPVAVYGCRCCDWTYHEALS